MLGIKAFETIAQESPPTVAIFVQGATFPVVNAAKTGEETDAGEPKMQTFAFRVKNAAQMDAFIDAVNANRQPAS